MKNVLSRLLRVLAVGLFTAGSLFGQASKDSMSGRPAASSRCEPTETLWKNSDAANLVPMSRAAFRQVAPGITELSDCDTTLQTFILKRRPSPWRLAFNAGPNFAYCGSWEGSFGANQRDNTLYNGAGIHLSTGLDYFFSRNKRLRFGLGGTFGYQNFFTRKNYKDYLIGLAGQMGIPSDQVALKNRPSEDFFLTLGPVITFNLKKDSTQVCGPYLEAALRGGVYRTDAALVGAYARNDNRLVRMVTPGSRVYQPGLNFSLGAFFPLRNNWHWGVQAQGWLTRQNYFIINGMQDILLDYTRKHGGFNAALAVRKSFTEKKLVPKSLAADCNTCTGNLTLALTDGTQSINGRTLLLDQLAENFKPQISWKSSASGVAERYTARLYYRSENDTTTTEVLQLVNSPELKLASREPLSVRPGYYYVTVEHQQQTLGGWRLCGMQVGSFAVKGKVDVPVPCQFRHSLSQIVVAYNTSTIKNIREVCYCSGERTETGKVIPRRFYRSGSIPQTMEPPIEYVSASAEVQLPTGAEAEKLAEVLKKLKKDVQAKGGKTKTITAIYRSEALPCAGNPNPGPAVTYQLTLSKEGVLTVTGLRPLGAMKPVAEKGTTPARKKAAKKK